MTRASDILTAALGHMQDRAATYDKPEGERSMPATVAAFNAITGLGITAEQGWLFAVLLKAVRSQQGGYRPDNYEDGAAYFALMGEQAAVDRSMVTSVDPTQGNKLERADSWTYHDGIGGHVCVPNGTAGELLHRDGTTSHVQYFDASDSYWNWLGKIARPTDIVAYRSA